MLKNMLNLKSPFVKLGKLCQFFLSSPSRVFFFWTLFAAQEDQEIFWDPDPVEVRMAFPGKIQQENPWGL